MYLLEKADARLSRVGGIAGAALGLMLATAGVRFLGLTAYLRESLPVIRLWAEPEAQRRAAFGDFPYDLLRQADALLPPQATVLLVTSGRDVRHTEYTTYHRALYYLAPRPVWWLSPAPPDGTWEARWWISAPVTAASIRATAADRQAAYLLAYDLPAPPALGETILEREDGLLIRLNGGGGPVAAAEARPENAGRLWPAQIAAGIAAIVGLGFAALRLAARRGFAARGAEAAALAWTLGAGGATLGMFWLDAAGLPLRWQIAALTAAAVAGFAWLRPTTDEKIALRNRPLRFTFYASLLLTLFAVLLTFVVLLAAGRPLTVWDSWANWGVKARTIFLEGGITPATTADPSRAVTHLDYPLMLPLLEAWLYAWLGAPDDRFAGLAAVLFYLALAGIVYGGARRLGAGARPALAAAVAAAAIPNVTLLAGFAFADAPLAALAAAAAIYLAGWLNGGPAGMLGVAAVAAGLMPWMKREGIVLAGALGLAALAAGGLSRRAWAGLGAIAGAAAAIAGPWWLLAARAGQASADFVPVSLEALAAHAGRLPAILRLALANLAGPDWAFAWPLAGLLGLAGWLAGRNRAPAGEGRRGLRVLPLAALLYLGSLSVAYVFSAYAPYQQHVLSSWHRLAAHVAALPVVWIAARPWALPAAQPAEDV